MLNANQLSPRDRVRTGRFSVVCRPREQQQKNDKQHRREKHDETNQNNNRLCSSNSTGGRVHRLRYLDHTSCPDWTEPVPECYEYNDVCIGIFCARNWWCDKQLSWRVLRLSENQN